MRNPWEIVRRPIITEKATKLGDQNKYVFEVSKDANKIEIRNAVQEMFDVVVTKVTTTSMRGKKRRMGRFQGRRPDWKKAVVTLREGDAIEVSGGV